jgi:integrase/recombinase XerD
VIQMLCKEITSTNTDIGERIYKSSVLFEIERVDRQTALRLNTKKQQPNFPELEAFETYLITQKGISPRVARNYFYSVRKFVRWANTGNPTESEAMGYYQYLQGHGYANSTIANIVYSLNHYFQFLGKKIKLTPPKNHKRQPNFLTVEEAQDLVKVVPNLRDRAIVMTLLYSGMRVSELCNLDFDDLHLENQEIVVRDTKTYRDRKVVISEKCVIAFEEYFESLSDSDKQAVFLSRRGRRISRNQVYTLTKKYGRLAGIKKNVTPHVLRHTLATNMIAHGASIIEVKEQLGHRSLESTLQYVHLQIDHRKTLYEAHCPQF